MQTDPKVSCMSTVTTLRSIDSSLDFKTLRSRYRSGSLRPSQVVSHVLDRIEERGDDGVWTYVAPRADVLARAAALEEVPPETEALPLYGLPFSVKDCIDIADVPTTCACPELAYTARATNPVIQRVLAAGAIFIGKTNLDQFATGLVGVRTPYGVSRNPFDAAFIPGGSSSGAAVSVAAGLVSFGVGTDTGGSGRVPAACGNIVGLKPTRGLLSTSHMVAANRSLDCLSVFALTCSDAMEVVAAGQAFDATNPFSRAAKPVPVARRAFHGREFRFAVPSKGDREFFGNADAPKLFEEAIGVLTEMGGSCVEIDYAPFRKVNKLLFDGPWVAERMASLKKLGGPHRDPLRALLPVTRQVMSAATRYTAVDAFEGLHELSRLRRQIEPLWSDVDVLVVPTIGTLYRISEVEADPIDANKTMGHYTYFVNLLDLAAIAVPNGFQPNRLPLGVTFVGPAFTDLYLAGLGGEFHRRRCVKLGATPFDLPH